MTGGGHAIDRSYDAGKTIQGRSRPTYFLRRTGFAVAATLCSSADIQDRGRTAFCSCDTVSGCIPFLKKAVCRQAGTGTEFRRLGENASPPISNTEIVKRVRHAITECSAFQAVGSGRTDDLRGDYNRRRGRKGMEKLNRRPLAFLLSRINPRTSCSETTLCKYPMMFQDRLTGYETGTV